MAWRVVDVGVEYKRKRILKNLQQTETVFTFMSIYMLLYSLGP